MKRTRIEIDKYSEKMFYLHSVYTRNQDSRFKCLPPFNAKTEKSSNVVDSLRIIARCVDEANLILSRKRFYKKIDDKNKIGELFEMAFKSVKTESSCKKYLNLQNREGFLVVEGNRICLEEDLGPMVDGANFSDSRIWARVKLTLDQRPEFAYGNYL